MRPPALLEQGFRKACRPWLVVLAAATCLHAQAPAHEFWLLAEPFNPGFGAKSDLTLHVGENFKGQQLPFTQAYVAGLSRFACGEQSDELAAVPQGITNMTFAIHPACPSVHVWAMDSHPNEVTLSADKFEAYLHDEGLDHIIESRKEQGMSGASARERYRRHVKSMVVANAREGASGDRATHMDVRTAQLLEIVPTSNLLFPASNELREFSIYFQGRPLVNSLIKAWHVQANQTTVLKARSDEKGRVQFSLPYPGAWMVSAVHMVKSVDPASFDWDSFWGNLTFHVPSSQEK